MLPISEPLAFHMKTFLLFEFLGAVSNTSRASELLSAAGLPISREEPRGAFTTPSMRVYQSKEAKTSLAQRPNGPMAYAMPLEEQIVFEFVRSARDPSVRRVHSHDPAAVEGSPRGPSAK